MLALQSILVLVASASSAVAALGGAFNVTPFKLNLSGSLARMNQLISYTVLPPSPELPDDADFGISLARLSSLKERWVDKHAYDWQSAQDTLNEFKQYTATIEGLKIHFIHEKSTKKDAIPLILLHGWPGSIHEFGRVIKPLIQPASVSGNGTTTIVSYNIIVPSLPGYVASSPAPANWTVDDTARVFNTLMVNVLGYSTFAGSAIGYSLYARFPRTVRAAQFTFLPFAVPSAQEIADTNITLNEFGQFALARSMDFSTNDFGYFNEQSTKPNTLGLALQDNPVGQLAWLAEKYDELSDPNGSQTDADIFTTTTLYFLSKTFLSSIYIYAQNPTAFSGTYTKAPTDAPML